MLVNLRRLSITFKKGIEPAVLCPEQADGCTNVGEWTVDARADGSDCGTSAKQPNPILILNWQAISSTGKFTPRSINFTFVKEEPFQVSSVDLLFNAAELSTSDAIASFPGGTTFEISNDMSLKCSSLSTAGSLRVGKKDSPEEPTVTFSDIQIQGAKGVLPFCKKDSAYQCGFSPEDTSCGVRPTTTSAPTTTTAPHHSHKKGMGVGGIAGISICVLLLGGGGLAYYVRYRVRQNRIKSYSSLGNDGEEFDE